MTKQGSHECIYCLGNHIVSVDQPEDNFLQSVGQELGDDLKSAIEERYGSEFCWSSCSINFGDQGNEGIIGALNANIARVKIMYGFVKVIGNNIPASFEECCIGFIWTR